MTDKHIQHVSMTDQKVVGMIFIVDDVWRCGGKGCSGWCASTGKV